MKRTLYFGAAILLATSMADMAAASPIGIPTFPQAPAASVSSYGAQNSPIGSAPSSTYIYGPLNASSGGSLVHVENLPACGTFCGLSDGGLAFGAAHASAGGDMGVQSYLLAPDGGPGNPYKGPMAGDSSASFSNSLVVHSAVDSLGHQLLPDNTPVQLSVSMLFDGSMDLFAGDLQKASPSPGYTASSDVSGKFMLYDPTITTSGAEGGDPVHLVEFKADANGNNASKYDGAKGRYVAEQSATTTWSLTSNSGDNLGQDTSYDCDGFVQDCGSTTAISGYITQSPLGFNFHTGIVTATLDTYIGATLNWDASMDVFNQVYGPTAGSMADFSHTFGVNINPNSSNVVLQFSQPQIPLSAPTPAVPEAPTLAVFLAGLFGLFGFAARGRRKA